MHVKEVITDIQAGKIAPVYFLVGAEPFFHDQVIHTLEAALFSDPSSRSLNTSRLYGTEHTLSDLLSAALGYPMLAKTRLVIFKEFSGLKLNNPDNLLNYINNPQQSTCLVLSCDEAARNKVYNTIKEKSLTVDCKPIPEYRIADWVQVTAKSKGLQMDMQVIRFLVDHTGNDLGSLSLELDKICDFKGDDTTVTLDDISSITGISKDTSVFALQSALGNKDIRRSLRISKRLLESGENINLIIAVLFSYFKRVLLVLQLKQKGNSRQEIVRVLNLRDFQLKELYGAAGNFDLENLERIIQFLATADTDVKSSKSDDNTTLQMLCYKICRD